MTQWPSIPCRHARRKWLVGNVCQTTTQRSRATTRNKDTHTKKSRKREQPSLGAQPPLTASPDSSTANYVVLFVCLFFISFLRGRHVTLQPGVLLSSYLYGCKSNPQMIRHFDFYAQVSHILFVFFNSHYLYLVVRCKKKKKYKLTTKCKHDKKK